MSWDCPIANRLAALRNKSICIQGSPLPAAEVENHPRHGKSSAHLHGTWCPTLLQIWTRWGPNHRASVVLQGYQDRGGLAKQSWCFEVQRFDLTWGWTWAWAHRHYVYEISCACTCSRGCLDKECELRLRGSPYAKLISNVGRANPLITKQTEETADRLGLGKLSRLTTTCLETCLMHLAEHLKGSLKI